MITEEGGKTMWLEWLTEKPQIQKQQAQMLVKPQLENHTPSGECDLSELHAFSP